MGTRDRAAFAEFATARAPALHRAAYLMVGDAQLAQDLVQEALTKTYVAWPRLRDPRNAEAYCRKAITTTAISWFRRKGWNNERPTETLPEGGLARARRPRSRTATAIWRALQALPPRQRAALVLRYYEDLTEAQTAEAMGCAVGHRQEPGLGRTHQAPCAARAGRRAALPRRDDRPDGGDPMTGQLRSTMQTRAGGLGDLDLDLDAIVHDGDRRLRRRRTAVAAGIVGVLAVVGATALTTRAHTTAAPGPAGGTSVPLDYAVGTVIHSGDTQVDVGIRVEEMVRTGRGFVFADPQQRVYEERDGQVEQIGHLADRSTPLVVGDDGLVVGWWDGERIQSWPGMNGNTDSFGPTGSWPADTPPAVRAISDGHLWYWDGHAEWIQEIRPLPSSAGWKDSNPPGSGTVLDAAGDRILVQVDGGMAVTEANLLPETVDAQDGWQPGGDLAGLTAQVPNVASGDLAPDGKHWFSHDFDEFAVFDSTSGARQDPSFKSLGFAFAAPYQWLDADTVAVLALRTTSEDHPPISLLTCQVSTDDCAVTARDIGDDRDVALPNGQSLREQ